MIKLDENKLNKLQTSSARLDKEYGPKILLHVKLLKLVLNLSIMLKY